MTRALLLTCFVSFAVSACGSSSSDDDAVCYGFEPATMPTTVVDMHRLVRIKADPTLANVFPPPRGETLRYAFERDSRNNYVALTHAPVSSEGEEGGTSVGTLVWPLAASPSEISRSVIARLYTCAPGERPLLLGEGRINECTNLDAQTTREADVVEVPGSETRAR